MAAKLGHMEGETLSAYVDGMLDMTRMREVAAHLGQCAVCRQQSESLQSTKALLHAVTTPEPPSPDYWANTFRRMRTEAPLRETRESARWTAFAMLLPLHSGDGPPVLRWLRF